MNVLLRSRWLALKCLSLSLCIAAVGAMMFAAPQKASATYSLLTDLSGIPSSLIIGQDGNLYGTLYRGTGVIFQVTPEGAYSVVYQGDFVDNLIQASDGTFYGAGATQTSEYLFRLLPDDTLQPITEFYEKGRGAYIEGLTEGLHGYLYGDTDYYSRSDFGTVFRVRPADGEYKKLDPHGDEAALYKPFGPLLLGRDGNLYGVTNAHRFHYEPGSIFKMTPAGDITILHTFDFTDGSEPIAPLTQDPATGTIYGATTYGGTHLHGTDKGTGTVFSITPGGQFKTLFDFNGPREVGVRPNRTGENPNAVVLGSNGYLYGTTSGGGNYARGVLYRMDPATGAEHVLYDFNEPAGVPQGQLVEGSGHILYGLLGVNESSAIFQFNVTP